MRIIQLTDVWERAEEQSLPGGYGIIGAEARTEAVRFEAKAKKKKIDFFFFKRSIEEVGRP